MTNAVMTNADMRYVNFTHTKLQGFDLGNGQLGDNTSGDIQGTPAALPPGWSVSGGYLTYFG